MSRQPNPSLNTAHQPVQNKNAVFEFFEKLAFHPKKALYFLVFLSVIVLFNTFHNGLFSDDLVYLNTRTRDQNPFDLFFFITEPYWGRDGSHAIYRPLITWSLSLTYKVNELLGLDGTAVFWYRVTNVITHGVCSFVFFRVLCSLGVDKILALFSGMLFVVHPVHAEAVNLIVNRSEIWGAGFGLWFCLLHVENAKLRKRALALFLAMLCKESAIAFLAFPVLWDFWKRTRFVWSEFKTAHLPAWGSYGCALIFWFLLRNRAVSGFASEPWQTANPLVGKGFLERLPSVFAVQWEYIKEMIFPARHVSDFHFDEIPLADSFFDLRVLSFFFLLAVIVWSAIHFKAKSRWIVFALIMYAAFSFPNSNFLATVGPYMAERAAYAPSLVFCAALLFGIASISERLNALSTGFVALCIIGVYGLWFHLRSDAWATEKSYYAAAASDNPRSYNARLQNGMVLGEQGKVLEASQEYVAAIQIAPEEPRAHLFLGFNFASVPGKEMEALAALRTALFLDPVVSETWLELSKTLQRLGRQDDVNKLTIEYLNLFPKDAQARVGISGDSLKDAKTLKMRPALALYFQQDYEGAAPMLEELKDAPILTLPGRFVIHSFLERIYRKEGKKAEFLSINSKKKELGSELKEKLKLPGTEIY